MTRLEELTKEDLLKKIADLKQEIAHLKRLIFGEKSEKSKDTSDLDAIQQELFTLEEESLPGFLESETKEISYTRRKKSKGFRNNPIPDDMHCEEILNDLSDEEKKCHCCGKEMSRIGEDEKKILEYQPAVFFAKKIITPKYACTCEDSKPVSALPISLPIDKSFAGSSLLAYITISKFVDHLPFYRLEQIFKRYNIFINRSTMCGWFSKLEPYFKIIHTAMIVDLLNSPYINADETTIKVQDKDKKGKCHKGFFWSYTNGNIVIFEYCKSRNSNHPVEFLKDFSGYLQTDDYAGYNKVVEKNGIKRLLCWAHARRKFFDICELEPEYTKKILAIIGKLYLIEKKCRDNNYTFDERKNIRQKEAPKILEALKKYLEYPDIVILPNSPVKKAINYILSNWDMLNVYLEDGQLEIDNNRIENAIRPIAIGRKNWLFSGSHNGAAIIAYLNSILGTCKLLGINPFEYIKYLLEVMPDYPMNKISELTPHNWLVNKSR